MASRQGKTLVRSSNINGFTNFVMSLFKEEADIKVPDEYRFRVIVPDGWHITTGNGTQYNEFKALQGTTGDIVARYPFKPVGLSPDLTLSGRIGVRGADDGLSPAQGSTVILQPTAGGTPIKVPVGPDGRYSTPIQQGAWRILAHSADETATAEREVTVGEAPVMVSTMVLGEELPPKAPNTHVIDFENLTGSELVEVASGVGNVNWHNMVATDFILYQGEGYMNTSMDGHFVAYNSSGHPAALWRDDSLDFVGSYFGVAWMKAEGETLSIKAWRDGMLVADDVLPLSSLTAVWYDAEFRGVQRIELKTEHYWQFVAEDFTVRTP
jgi:hypothetical protein